MPFEFTTLHIHITKSVKARILEVMQVMEDVKETGDVGRQLRMTDVAGEVPMITTSNDGQTFLEL